MKAAPGMIRTRVIPTVAGATVAAVLAAGAWYGYEYATTQPIRHVVFAGDTARIARADLEAFAASLQGASPGSASLAEVREAARRIPWVRDAAVRRRFPDGIEVSFVAHEALARWADGGLVSPRGDVFAAGHAGFLPLFRGPEGAAPSMAQAYPALVRAVTPLAAALVELRVSPRGAWQAVLDSGLVLELGREDIVARVERFAAAYPRLPAGALDGKHADLRYNNGFAMKTGNTLPAPQKGRRK
jgi:cell division protein FtsQ